MFKRLIVCSAILATTTSVALANPAPYIGAGLGIVNNTTEEPYVFGSYRGVPINVLAGYGGLVSQSFYLAGELNGTIATSTITDDGGIKTTYGYGVSLLPGVMLTDHTLAFVRLGVVRTRFSEMDVSRTGAQVGFGLQTSLTQSVDLRGEYDFTAYRSVNSSYFSHYISTSTKPRQDAFNLSLIYKFD